MLTRFALPLVMRRLIAMRRLGRWRKGKRMMTIEERVELYAKAAHDAVGQRRKYTGEPYWMHTAAVAEAVKESGGTPEMVAAAHLHDTVEDRSEEHTSELQSRPHLVCRLL